MIIALLGAAGFIAGFLFDLLSVSKQSAVRGVVFALSTALFCVAHFAAVLSPERVYLHSIVRCAGWVILLFGVILMAYSLFLEIPFRQTYTERGSGKRGLVQEGTYALTRHPGVLWYVFVLLGMFMVSGSRVMLLAGPIWLLLEVTWVWMEDRFTFERLFPEYPEYRRTTPMLIPTRDSASRCWKTLALADAWRQILPPLSSLRPVEPVPSDGDDTSEAQCGARVDAEATPVNRSH